NGTLPTNSSGLQDETNVLAEDLQESLDDLITSGLDLEVDGYTYSLDIGGVIVSDVILVCMDGEVPATNGECAVCPSGTFTNEDQSACLLCGQDTYQEKTGQFGCLECPEGTVTFGQGGDNITMCLELCDAGYQSYHGVEPCDPCPLGFYKQSDMNPWCKACSEDYPNTKLVGSTSDAACLKSDHTMDDIGMNLLYATIAIGVCGVVIIILSVTYWQYRKRIMKRKERNPTLENEHILERVFEMKVDQIANCHSPVRRPLNGVMDSHYNDSISSIHDIPTSSPRYMPRQVRFRDAPSIISSSHSETHFKPIHSAIGEEVEEELSSYQSEDRNSMSSYQNDVSSEMLVLSPSSLQDTYFDSDRHIHDSIRYSATNVPVQNQNTLPEIPPPMQQIGLGQQLQSSDPSAHISSLKMVLSKIISESSSQSQSQPASYPPVDYHDHRYYDRVLANPIREPDLDIIQTRDNTTSNWTSNFQLRRTPTPENTLITSPEQQEYQFGRQLLNDLSHSYADCDNNENTIHL
ncbi:uncharacterized protein LOC100368322, partial [Saccoglossus kowalevskii]|uniref:Uncharacterized protein LOC100368322 n=1 Tax=Saccoglossus kowalevskii TaxID=10224 RepID=A0ABM0GM44_SACKO